MKLAVFQEALSVKLIQSTCQLGPKHQCTNWRALPGLEVSKRRSGEVMSQVSVLPPSLWMKKELVVGVKLKLPLQIKPFASICCLDPPGSVSMWEVGLQVPQPQAAYVLIFN